MTTLDAGIYGAKRQSLRKTNPRDLLSRLISENQHVGEASLQALFLDAARDDPDMVESIIEYWFTNNYRSLTLKSDRNMEAIVKARTVKAAVQTIRERAEKMVLLDLVMANGKPLKDCTGKECSKFGGWFVAIAKNVKANQKVGSILSEDQLRKLYK